MRAGRFAGFHDVLAPDLEATAAVVREHQEHIKQRTDARVPAPRPQGSKKKRRKRR
ncbi:hypothetical protein ACFT8W_20885 [Streptomyces hygroscopicus]|uniref:hypothetical protein n=1 Tax=Streptomyces hygroscopicus TaxID=1912 RepID=UPI0036426EA1